MASNTFVCWREHPEAWELEEELITQYDLPLNLAQNKHKRVPRPILRRATRGESAAAHLPILPR